MNLVKGRKLGGYELVMRIGRGGMASVWLARERTPDREADELVALKIMLPELAGDGEFMRMFLDEVRLARAIRHANVASVHEVGEDDGVMWMAMEWVEGESLQGVFAEASKRRPIPTEIAVRIIADAAAGLHAAHELRDVNGCPQNLVHRDVSPHNILIGTAGQVKLVDFGVAKAIDRMSEKTRTGHLKGKYAYMPPEQVAGSFVDRRADVFSLGIVLYELTTNRRLFRGRNDMHTLQLVLAGHVPPPSSVETDYPPDLERIVLKALERDVERRYTTAADLEAALRAFLKASGVVVPRSGVAGLLKRVAGPRIEARRRALREALADPHGSERATVPDLISPDPAFTPTSASRPDSKNPPTKSGSSEVTPLSQFGSLARSSRPGPASSGWRSIALVALLLASASAYLLIGSRLKPAPVRDETAQSAQPPEPRAVDRRKSARPEPAVVERRDTSGIPVIRIEDLKLEAPPAKGTAPAP